MAFSIVLSSDAIADIDQAVGYYNSVSQGLGFEFADTLDWYFNKIADWPTASAVRYDNVRVKPIDIFPFTIHFTIENDAMIIILRVFNNHQKPLR